MSEEDQIDDALACMCDEIEELKSTLRSLYSIPCVEDHKAIIREVLGETEEEILGG
jgi:hypothetical protein